MKNSLQELVRRTCGRDSLMAKWTGLDSAQLAKGVTRTNIALVDKVWMLETISGWVNEAANDAERRMRA